MLNNFFDFEYFFGMRVVSPPIAELDKLRTPLTEGEREVFELFHSHLPEAWEIYIQPHLNGLRPDFVLLNPNLGIAVYEVKDWDFEAMEYHVSDERSNPPQLWARTKNGKTMLITPNPVEKLHYYKSEIYELYCPRLQHPAGFAVINAGLIFTRVSTYTALRLLEPCLKFWNMKYPQNVIVGRDMLDRANMVSILPALRFSYSRLMNPALAQDLRNWLIEPDFAATQREPLRLDENQMRIATTRTATGYRRIKGPAGSGKSLALAARAAQLASEGKNVLVVTYNITLIHYLRDLAVRWPAVNRQALENITFMNFHYWCKRVCYETNNIHAYRALWRNYKPSEPGMTDLDPDSNSHLQYILCKALPNLVNSILENNPNNPAILHDAILVDEGQDFLPNWWNVLRKACRQGGEMVLVADATQDIYENARKWTDDVMEGAGFRGGRWVVLPVSYRLPSNLIQVARRFAAQFLPRDQIDLPQSPQNELELYPCHLEWVQTTEPKAAHMLIEALNRIPTYADPRLLAIADITILVPSHAFGCAIVNKLESQFNIKVLHTFSETASESRRLKHAFFMGDARIKATTLHSFKGWESRAIVLYTGHKFSKKSLALIYTGLTRVKRHSEGSFITVVCAIPELREYGKTWDHFIER